MVSGRWIRANRSAGFARQIKGPTGGNLIIGFLFASRALQTQAGLTNFQRSARRYLADYHCSLAGRPSGYDQSIVFQLNARWTGDASRLASWRRCLKQNRVALLSRLIIFVSRRANFSPNSSGQLTVTLLARSLSANKQRAQSNYNYSPNESAFCLYCRCRCRCFTHLLAPVMPFVRHRAETHTVGRPAIESTSALARQPKSIASATLALALRKYHCHGGQRAAGREQHHTRSIIALGGLQIIKIFCERERSRDRSELARQPGLSVPAPASLARP